MGRGRRSHIDQAGYPATLSSKTLTGEGLCSIEGQEPQGRPVRTQCAGRRQPQAPSRPCARSLSRLPSVARTPPLLTGSGEQRRPSAAGNSQWRATVTASGMPVRGRSLQQAAYAAASADGKPERGPGRA